MSPSSQGIFDLFISRRTVLIPLRYPGGKRRLAPYVAAALAENDLRPDLFVEPYGGGASVALELLHFDLVDRVVLGDRDPLTTAPGRPSSTTSIGCASRTIGSSWTWPRGNE